MGPETKIENYFVDRITEIGGLCWKFNSRSQAGVPDRIVIYDRHVCFVEVKSEVGKLSKLQSRIISKIRDQNIPVFVINSKEMADQVVELICGESR